LYVHRAYIMVGGIGKGSHMIARGCGMSPIRREFSTWLQSGAVEVSSRGAGGRSSVSGIVATVFGCTGFLGRYVVNRLGRSGTQVVVPWRGDGLNYRHLKLMGDLGQIVPMEWDLREESSIRSAMIHSDVVINLVGKHFETRNYSFTQVHEEGAATIARIAREVGVSQFIHVSGAGVSLDSLSAWKRSKAAGEIAVRQEFPSAVIVRPTDLFGFEDRLLTRIGKIISKFYMYPLINEGNCKIQPVWVEDVAGVISAAVRDPEGFSGKTLELGGPRVMTMRELVEFAQETTKKPVRYPELPVLAARLIARLYGLRLPALNPEPFFVEDDIFRELEGIVAVPAAGSLTFTDLEIVPTDPTSDDGRTILRLFREGGDRSSLFSSE